LFFFITIKLKTNILVCINIRLKKQELVQYLPLIQKDVKHSQTVGSNLINSNDEISRRLKSVYDAESVSFNPIKAENEMLSKSPMTTLTGLPKIPQNLSRERASRLQELLHFCITSDVTHAG
jgi:hypothetical protein